MIASSEKKEFGDKKIPDDIVESAIILQKQLHQSVGLKDPISRAYAIQFFKDTYSENKLNPYHHTFRAVSALHLASKVCEDAKILSRFVTALEECKRKENVAAALTILGPINDIGKEFVPFVTSQLKTYELDLIQDLQFNFQVTLPYDYIYQFIATVIHWHVSERFTLFESIQNKVTRSCNAFLNDLQMSPIFYNYSPKVVAVAAVRLSFVMQHLKVPNLNTKPWYSVLVPDEKTETIDECTDKIRKYFESKGFYIEKFETPSFSENALEEWIFTPIEDCRGKEPICDPPSIELLEEFTGKKDAFNTLWSDHIPSMPPPDCSEYVDAIRIAAECQKNGELIVSRPKPKIMVVDRRSEEKKTIVTEIRHKDPKRIIIERKPQDISHSRSYDNKLDDRRNDSFQVRRDPPPLQQSSNKYDRNMNERRTIDSIIERRPDFIDRRSIDQMDRRMQDHSDRRPQDYIEKRTPEIIERRSQIDTYNRRNTPGDSYDRRAPQNDQYDRVTPKDNYERRIPPPPEVFDRRNDGYDRKPIEIYNRRSSESAPRKIEILDNRKIETKDTRNQVGATVKRYDHDDTRKVPIIIRQTRNDAIPKPQPKDEKPHSKLIIIDNTKQKSSLVFIDNRQNQNKTQSQPKKIIIDDNRTKK